MSEVYVPHIGWLTFEEEDDVAEFLNGGWFEYLEQAFLWLFLRPGDRFLDCGAHVGLFSVLASRVTNGNVHILAIEPNPPTLTHLRNNLLSCEAQDIEIIAAAVFSESGKSHLSVGKAGKSAYSSVAFQVSDNSIVVDTHTIDDLLESRNIELVEFMKLDVEGAEKAVLSGAFKSVREGRLPVVMIEFTESNLNQVGMCTDDLRNAWEGVGYQLCRFDAETFRLSRYSFDGPIGYENLIAVMDFDAVNRRLGNADEVKRRIATEIVNRGSAAKNLFEQCTKSNARAERAEKALATLQQAFRNLQNSKRALENSKRALENSKRALENSKRMRLLNKLLLPLDWLRRRRNL